MNGLCTTKVHLLELVPTSTKYYKQIFYDIIIEIYIECRMDYLLLHSMLFIDSHYCKF